VGKLRGGNGARRVPLLARVAPLAAAVLLAVAGCGGGGGTDAAASAPPSAPVTPEWQKVIDAAKGEGSVTIYSSQGTDQLKALGDAFQKTYGIKVDVLRDVDATLGSKVDAERASNSPVADVLATANGAYIADKGSQGWWSKPSGPDFGVAAYDQAKNVSPDGSFLSSAAVYVVGWNTQAVPAGLTSYKDLLKPELTGKVGVIDPAVSPAVVDFYDYVAQQNGPQFLDELAAQKPQIFNSVLTAGQALTSGQISAAVAVQALTDEKEQGAPVDFLVPKPAWGAPFHTAVLAKAPHPNAAQLLADFMISPAGQTLIARKAASVLPNIPGAVTTISDVQAFDPTKLSTPQVEQFRSDFRSKFQ
jgi:iron(III) transport system substrate-binding protein